MAVKAQTDDRRKPGWWWADNEVLDKHGAFLKAGGIAVYAALCRIAGERRKAWPSYRKLAELTGMGRTGVRDAISRLESVGLLSVEARRNEEGDADSNLYVLLPVGGGSETAHPGRQATDGCAPTDPRCAATGLEEYSVKNTQRKKPPVVPLEGDDPDFDRFWTDFPNKKNKPGARRAWKQTKKARPPLPTLLAALQRDKASDEWRRDDGKFIPHPASWLRGERWNDEAAVVPESEPTSDAVWEEVLGRKRRQA